MMMPWTDSQHLLALLNFLSCNGIVYYCICRLNTEKARTSWMARLRYTLLLATAASSGLQPVLWGEWSSWSDAVMSLAVCLWLMLSTPVPAEKYDGPRRRVGDM